MADLVDDIREKLAGEKIGETIRRQLLDEVIPFIKSGNAGLDDARISHSDGALSSPVSPTKQNLCIMLKNG